MTSMPGGTSFYPECVHTNTNHSILNHSRRKVLSILNFNSVFILQQPSQACTTSAMVRIILFGVLVILAFDLGETFTFISFFLHFALDVIVM